MDNKDTIVLLSDTFDHYILQAAQKKYAPYTFGASYHLWAAGTEFENYFGFCHNRVTYFVYVTRVFLYLLQNIDYIK